MPHRDSQLRAWLVAKYVTGTDRSTETERCRAFQAVTDLLRNSHMKALIRGVEILPVFVPEILIPQASPGNSTIIAK